MQQYIFKQDNFTVSYKITGEGTPVVLLHGFGEDSTIFNNQINAFKGKCQLIIPDIPGTGNSYLNYNEVLADMGTLADCIKALLYNLQIEKCILLGHSMGGYITLSFAEKYPDCLLAFGLIHSTAFADTTEKITNRKRGITLMEEYGAASFLKNTLPNLFSSVYKEQNNDELNNLINQFSHITTEACVFYYTAMIARTDKTSVLKNNKLPVLFVIGEDDIAAPMADVLQQVSLPMVSSIHILKKVGHMSMVEAPDKLNNILIDFLENKW